MTREDKLYSMRMTELKMVADKLGIKINAKAAKSKAIEKILDAEADLAKANQKKIQAESDKAAEDAMNKKKAKPINIVKPDDLVPAEKPEKPEKPKTKRTNLKLTELTYNGETKSIKDWAAEIGMPTPTLYDRVNRNGWTVEEAIETPLGQRRPK